MATVPATVESPTIAMPARAQLGGATAMQQTIEDLNMVRAFVAREMRKDLDFGVIPGTGTKPTLLLPGAQKIALYFNCYPDYDIQPHELGAGHVEYIIKTRLISRASGNVIGTGLGSCSTMEGKYRFRTAARQCPSCGSEAIIKGKAEFGGGWVCFKKKGGCGAKFTDDDQAIISQAGGKAENDNIHDQRNTCLKMGKKRSLVDAALSLGCMAELFTQDLEEFHQFEPRQAAEEPERPEPPRDDQADRRRRVNEQFGQPARRETTGGEQWGAWISRTLREALDDWQNEMAREGVDKGQRKDLTNVDRVVNHLCTLAIQKQALKPERIAKDGKPEARDPSKAKLWVAKRFAKDPETVKTRVEEYLASKRRELRAELGMFDPDSLPPEPEAATAPEGKGDAYEGDLGEAVSK